MRHHINRCALMVFALLFALGCESKLYQGPASVLGPPAPIEVGQVGAITVYVMEGARAPLYATRIAARSQDITIAEASVETTNTTGQPIATVKVAGKKPGKTTIDLKYTHPGRNRPVDASVEVEIIPGGGGVSPSP